MVKHSYVGLSHVLISWSLLQIAIDFAVEFLIISGSSDPIHHICSLHHTIFCYLMLQICLSAEDYVLGSFIADVRVFTCTFVCG